MTPIDDDEVEPRSRTSSFDDLDIRIRETRALSWPQYGHKVKHILIMNVKHHIIAEQLTLMMHSVYLNIDFSRSEGVCYFSDQYTDIFNHTVKWVQYSILGAINCKER